MKRTLKTRGTLALLLLTSHGVAGDPALAETLFRQARDLMQAGDYDAACPKLEESFVQDAATGTLLALALCQEQAGKTASAWATYGAVIARSAREGQTDREAAAKERQRDLEDKLSRLTLEVPQELRSVPGLLIQANGNPVGEGAWGIASPVDPGEHQIDVTAPGKVAWRSVVSVGAVADHQTVRVPVLENAPAPETQTAVSPAAPSKATPPASVATATDSFPLDTLGLVVAGAGAIGLGVSGYFGLRASGLYEDSKRPGLCDADNTCDPKGLELRRDAIDAATLTTVFLVTGSMLTASGVTLYVLGNERDPERPEASVTPALTHDAASLVLKGRF